MQQLLAQDADAALALLADLVHATDESLREAARLLAARLVLDRARVGRPQLRGIGRLRRVRADQGGDLDVDSSLDAVVSARAEGRQPALDELSARDWSRPELAIALVVDTSGSMSGSRLAAAALTAAACAWRAPAEHAVITFAREVTVLRSLDSAASPSAEVDAVLALRGHGITGLAGALRAANDALASARASRRLVLLLSDCRATDEVDPVPAGSHTPELLILAPADDCAEAAEFAAACGARWAPLSGPADAPTVLADLLR